jgi:hypothetical protein
LPNSTDVVVPAFALASEANSTPSAVARARIVPVAISRSATFRPNSPISTPPATQKTASPSVTGAPIRMAPVAPGKPMWARAWAAKAFCRVMTK